jgi:hypothetical protein
LRAVSKLHGKKNNVRIACQVLEGSVRIICYVLQGFVQIACHVSEVYVRIACRFDFRNFFYYLFLISWDAVFYQSIFTLILTLVILFLSIIDNISKIISYNFKVNRLYQRFPKNVPWNLRVLWDNLEDSARCT